MKKNQRPRSLKNGPIPTPEFGPRIQFNIGLSAAVILRVASLHRIQPGTIYAILAYLWNFIASLNNVPMLVQQLSRLKDIATRMEQSIVSHKPVNGPQT